MNLALAPLPYATDALEPCVSQRTVRAHHEHHHAGYVERTRELVKDSRLESASLEEIIRSASGRDEALFNAAAQVWNHEFYWNSLRPGGGGDARGTIAELLARAFGSQQEFRKAFVAMAGEQFGSGWAWLVLDAGELAMVTTANAGTPLVSLQVPLLAVDLWEHAYYLDFAYRRAGYVAATLDNLLNWDFASRNLARACADRTPPEYAAR